MPRPLMRLARPPGICPVHSCDWLALQEKLAKLNMYAKQPDPRNDVRSVFAPHNNYINYAARMTDGSVPDYSLSSPKKVSGRYGCYFCIPSEGKVEDGSFCA
eukprot:1195829-Prorocentrum_minimum.AAC.3